MTLIAGQESRYRNLPSTLAHDEGNIASERTSDRLRREAAEVALRKPAAQKHPWVLEGEAEQAAKEKADRDAVARGTLKILPDGTRVEKFSGLKRL